MLLQFFVENFKSFKDQAVLSLEASADSELPGNVTSLGKERCLNTAAVFGANAAGKSNIFSAITAAIMTIRRSNVRQVNEPIFDITPYSFSAEAACAPTSFEFVFLSEGKKYVYGFSATQKVITREYLYVFQTSKASTVFERTSPTNFKYTSPAVRRELKPIEERNTENKLFLATATMWNCEATRIPFVWFQSKINTYPANFERLFSQAVPMFENDTEHTLKNFTTNLLHEADINIDDYSFESKDFPQDQPAPEMGIAAYGGSGIRKKLFRVETVHTITDGDTVNYCKLDLMEESQGTRNLFMLSPVLKRAFEAGETVCIDEFDASLHPMLVIYLVGLFNNPEINKGHAQLIISSHTMALLSLKILRRDQIYFVEKKRETGASELYSLDEFSPRKQENIRKAYLLGRYGSVPDISEEAMLWE